MTPNGAPRDLFEAADSYKTEYGIDLGTAVVTLALHELVKAAWSINEQLTYIKNNLPPQQ